MYYSKINKMDIANGDGIRVSLFVSGCRFHCYNCFNQEAQNFKNGKYFDEEAKSKLLELVSSPHIAGLSILGGDPLWQSPSDMEMLTDICREVHKMGKTVWLWSGFTYEEIFPTVGQDYLDINRIARQTLVWNCDVFVDGQFIDGKKDLTLKWRGSSNQRVIDIHKTIVNEKITLYCD